MCCLMTIKGYFFIIGGQKKIINKLPLIFALEDDPRPADDWSIFSLQKSPILEM